MKYPDYKEAVKRTLPTLGDWHGNPVILDSLHCLAGVFSEYYELDEALVKEDSVNVGEELTDKLWYISNYCNVRVITPILHISKITFSTEALPLNARHQRIEAANKMVNLSLSELINYDKKEFAYRKVETPVIRARREALVEVVLGNLSLLYAYNDLDPERCMQNNIDKLIARFPIEDGFTIEAANNRNLEAERKQLEN